MGQSPALYADSSTIQLLEPWIRRHLPRTHETVLRRFIQLTTGIFEQRSVLMERIAEGSAFRGTMSSNTTQVRRILRDTRIHLETVYYPFIKSLLRELPNDVLYFSMDESAHTDGIQIFQVGIITDACTLPLGFIVYDRSDAWADDARLLLEIIATLIPSQKTIILLADRIHAGEPFIRTVEKIGWNYIFRLPEDTFIETAQGWKTVKQLYPRRTSERFWTAIRVWKKASITAQVGIFRYKRDGFQTVRWYLISNLPATMERFKEYACRWWQECGFKQMKSGLFEWERSRVTLHERVEILLMGLYIATWALWIIGREHEQRPQRKATTELPQRRRKNIVKQGIRAWVDASKHHKTIVLHPLPRLRVLDYERMFTT